MMKPVLATSFIFLIILSSFAYADGSSTGGSSSNSNSPSRTRSVSNASSITTCETYGDIASRIRCRLQNRAIAVAESANVTEEACRGLANATISSCERLYQRSHACYDESSPLMKKRCFLNESGINLNAGGTFRAAPSEAKRNYVVLLLYELQERIEEKQENGDITVDQATSLISKIVEIKKMILNGERRSAVVIKINEFKTEYRSVMAGA